MKKTQAVQPEWSHKIDAADIGLTPISTSISASPQERKDLARRMGVELIEKLEAQLVLQRLEKNLILHVAGDLRARVMQPCVVTLEPIQQDIESKIEGWFADAESVVPIARVRHERQGKTGAELKILEEEDDPEPLIDGEVDLGELVAQHLCLSINPYPHKEGAAFEQESIKNKGNVPETRQNPFAVLKNWKKGKKSGN